MPHFQFQFDFLLWPRASFYGVLCRALQSLQESAMGLQGLPQHSLRCLLACSGCQPNISFRVRPLHAEWTLPSPQHHAECFVEATNFTLTTNQQGKRSRGLQVQEGSNWGVITYITHQPTHLSPDSGSCSHLSDWKAPACSSHLRERWWGPVVKSRGYFLDQSPHHCASSFIICKM